jgi:hypothetical protein
MRRSLQLPRHAKENTASYMVTLVKLPVVRVVLGLDHVARYVSKAHWHGPKDGRRLDNESAKYAAVIDYHTHER